MEKLFFDFFFLSVTKPQHFLSMRKVLYFFPLLFLHLGDKDIFNSFTA